VSATKTALITAAAVASPILGGFYSRLKQGQAEKQAARDQAAAAQLEADAHKLRGVQIGEQSRDQLDRTLAAISTIRAQRGLSSDSETAQAIERKTVDNAYRNEAVAILGEQNAQQAALWATSGYRRAARNAMPMAWLDAGVNAGQQISKVMMAGA
jgi:hypothetical protein